MDIELFRAKLEELDTSEIERRLADGAYSDDARSEQIARQIARRKRADELERAARAEASVTRKRMIADRTAAAAGAALVLVTLLMFVYDCHK
jgi:hypothetical protein